MSQAEEEFDDTVMHTLSLDKEEASYLRGAVLDLNYDVLYKHLQERHERFVKKVRMTYLTVIVMQVITLAIFLFR